MNKSSLHRMLAVSVLAFLPAGLAAASSFYIEAEDFDYNGGRHRPEADVMPYYGGVYASLGAQVGVDYYRNDVQSSGGVYRSGEDPNVPMFEINALNTPELMSRDGWTMNVNYRLGWMSQAYGVWMNYTRVFPAGRYQVYAAMTYGDSTPNAIKASLSRVASGVGTADQTLEALGEFLGDGSGSWDRNTMVPLRKNGAPAVLELDGLATLRFTAGEGDFDYLLFRPEGAPDATVTPLLNVDFCAHLNWSFTNKVGPAAIGQGPNDFWNLYSRDDGNGGFLPSGSVIDLKWADGTVSPVDLAVANAPGMWPSGSADPMMQSYLYPLGGGDMSVTLTELPSGTYDLYFYAHGQPDGENGVVQVTCNGVDYGTRSTTTAPGWNTTNWQEGQQYVLFQNILGSSQPLVITVKPGSTGLAVMNGMQLLAKTPKLVPLGHWRFEETEGTVAHDGAGAFPGNLSSTGASFVPGGIAGRALYVDRAANGFVNMGNVLGMETGDFSLVAWIKMNPGDTTESSFIVSKHVAGYANGYGLIANSSTTWGSPGRAWFYDSGVWAGAEVISTTTVNDGSWHQVVGVYQAGGVKRIYVDGAPAEASANAVPIVGNSEDFLVGAYNLNGLPTAAFTGWIDEVQVYGRALSASDVDFLFQNPAPPPPPFNLATNGSFELPPGIVTYRVFAAGADLPGWIVEQGTVEIVGPYWQAAEGSQSLDLNGTFEDIGTISHPVSTEPGRRYKVRFAYAGNPEGGPAAKTTRVFWDDTVLAEVSFDTTGRSLADMGWVYYEYEVTATSTSSLLKFQSTTPTFCGPALDDVSVTLLDGPPPPPQCVAAPAGLVAWWPAEDNPDDAMGANDGTAANGLSYSTGRVGQAFLLDGVDDEVPILASPSLNVQSFTIEAWINPADVTTLQPIVEYCADSGWSGVHLWIAVHPQGGGSAPATLFANVRDAFATDRVIVSQYYLISANQWSHVALTFEQPSGEAGLYLNGESVASANLGVFTPQTALPLHIGRRPAGSYDPGAGAAFNGRIDEVAIYNRALSGAEVQTVFAAGSAGKCPPTPPPSAVVADWTFEEGTPGSPVASVADASGNGHVGSIIYGNPTFASSPPGAGGSVSLALGSDSGFRPQDDVAFSFGDAFTMEAMVMPAANNDGPWGRFFVGAFNPVTGVPIVGFCYRGEDHVAIIGTMTAPIPLDGALHHVATVYARPTLTLFLDGQLAGTMTYDYPFPPAGEPVRLTVGCDYNGGYWFGGLIDRVRISSRALQPSEFFAPGSPPAFNDGIPDSWRQEHFGPGFATDPRAAATADPDGDGANNYREFLDGTDPLNASSVKRVPVAVSTFAGSTRGAQDGFRTEARFNYLPGFAFDGTGRLWIPEASASGYDQPGDGFQRVRLLDANGMVSVLTGAEAGLVDGPLDQARFSGPLCVVFDSHGNAFVLDMFNHRVRRIDVNGVVSTFAGSTRGYRDGPALEAQFDLPHGMAIDAQDNLFIADWFNLRVRKITPQGEVSTFSGSTRGAQDGPRLEATYDGPVDLVVEPSGVIYVSDWANGRIRKIDANGDVSTFVSGLSYTEMLSLGSDGGVYCYAAGLRQMNKYNAEGAWLWSWSTPEGSDDGPIGVARFGGRLTKVVELADGNLLIADDARIRLVTTGVPPLLSINPPGGVFANQVEVTLTTVVADGVIRFTTDGAEPTAASPAYVNTVLLTASTTLKARVFVNDTPVSDIALAEFTRAPGDEQAPVVTITSPAPGPTENEFVQLSGTVTDNVGVVSARLEWDGQPPMPLPLNDGQILGPVIRLHGGENRLRVIATDAVGNEGSAEVLVTWTPARVLFVVNPDGRQEGKKVHVPIKLVSNGDVGGLTFVLRYNPDYLRPLELDWIAAGESSFKQVNLDVPGEIRATFALMGAAIPAGTQPVATVVFRARSVPATLTTELPLELVDVSDVVGNSIGFGNEARSGVAQLRVRRIVGDNNANQRLDTGDATAIQRLLAALDPLRDWDRTGNDVNQNTQLDSGDVVRVLRVVVGLDPQPMPASAGKAKPGAPTFSEKDGPGSAGSAVLSADILRGQPGDRVTVQVRLQDVPVPISGAAFTLEYSTNALRLMDRQSHRLGALVAGNTLGMWNVAPPQNDYRVQPGRVSLGLSSATAWPESNGVLAEFTFVVQPGQSARYCWPVRLSGVEVTSAHGLDVYQLPDAEVRFIGRDPIRPNLEPPTVSASGDGVQLRLVGEADVRYVIEASSNLTDWTPIGTVESPDGVLNFSDPAIAGSGQRFYRLRQQ